MNIFSITYMYIRAQCIVISTAQTDFSLRSRTFSININWFITFLKDCVYAVR